MGFISSGVKQVKGLEGNPNMAFRFRTCCCKQSIRTVVGAQIRDKIVWYILRGKKPSSVLSEGAGWSKVDFTENKEPKISLESTQAFLKLTLFLTIQTIRDLT